VSRKGLIRRDNGCLTERAGEAFDFIVCLLVIAIACGTFAVALALITDEVP
jgi:hypothetical protein